MSLGASIFLAIPENTSEVTDQHPVALVNIVDSYT